MVDLPFPEPDDDRIDAVLREGGGPTYQRPATGSFWSLSAWLRGPRVESIATRRRDGVSSTITDVASGLGRGLRTPVDKAHVVAALLGRRVLLAGTRLPRTLGVVRIASALTRNDGAYLVKMLLSSLGAETRVVRAELDGEAGMLCIWAQGDRWYGLPVWPARSIRVEGVTVHHWRADDAGRPNEKDAGWSLIAAYDRLEQRSLPAVIMNATGKTPGSACPRYDSPMRMRAGRTPFWGCARYPACTGTRQVEEGPSHVEWGDGRLS